MLHSSVTTGAQFAANWAKNKTPGAQMWNFRKKSVLNKHCVLKV